jgi:hypothetical protein
MQSYSTDPTPEGFVKTRPRHALQEVAARVEAPLKLAAPFDQYILPPEGFHQLGLAGVHQRVNASLAVQLAATWEQAAGHSCGGSDPAGAAKRAQQVAQLQLPDAYAAGLRQCVWPGRAQVIITHSQGVICGCSRECFAMLSERSRSECCEQQIFDAIVRCFQAS